MSPSTCVHIRVQKILRKAFEEKSLEPTLGRVDLPRSTPQRTYTHLSCLLAFSGEQLALSLASNGKGFVSLSGEGDVSSIRKEIMYHLKHLKSFCGNPFLFPGYVCMLV